MTLMLHSTRGTGGWGVHGMLTAKSKRQDGILDEGIKVTEV